MDCNPPGSSDHGILQQEYWSVLPFLPPGDLLDRTGIEPTCHISCTGRQVLYHQHHWSGFISVLLYYCVSRNREAGGVGERRTADPWSSQNTHLYYVRRLIWAVNVALQQFQWKHQRSLITDHHNKYHNKKKKICNAARTTKTQQRHEVNKRCWKKRPRQTWSMRGCHKHSIKKKKKKNTWVKHRREK